MSSKNRKLGVLIICEVLAAAIMDAQPRVAAPEEFISLVRTPIEVHSPVISEADEKDLLSLIRSGDVLAATQLFNRLTGRTEVLLPEVTEFEGAIASVTASAIGTRGQTIADRTPSQRNLEAASDFVSGASSLTTAGAVPFITSPGVLGQDAGLTFSTQGSVLRLGKALQQVEIRPKNTEPYGVMSIRSATPNTPTAWLISPNGVSSQGAWIDICNDDLILNPTANWRCLIMQATPNGYFLGVHHLNYKLTPSKPLYIGGESIELRAQSPFSGITMAKFEEGTMTLFDTANGKPYFGIRKSIQKMRLISSMQLGWSPDDSVYSGTDVGIGRGGRAVLKITDGNAGYGSIDAAGYNSGGIPGVTKTCVGPVSAITITGGIVTSISCP